MTTRWVIGLAPGSSLDGVDAALIEMQGTGLDLAARLVQTAHRSYPRDLRNLLLRAADAKQLGSLHRLLGETFAQAARQVADQGSFSLPNALCIGCPGHTAWRDLDARFPGLLDVGMAAVVAERTGVTVVSDFRARDVAAGGQAVPLTALADYLLFRSPEEVRVLVHLSGVASVLYLPAGGPLGEVIGLEAGPCTLLLDSLIRELTAGREAFDPGGKHAVQGRCLEPVLAEWLQHPYWQRRPPKGLPAQAFGTEFVGAVVNSAREQGWQLHDVLCTATHLVARGVVGALKRFLPGGTPVRRILLSGGGVRNGFLWQLLEQQMPGALLTRTDALGVPAGSRKALASGVLAALTVDGVPGNAPSATGAAAARLLGSLTPGSSANWARCVAWMAAQLAPFGAARYGVAS